MASERTVAQVVTAHRQMEGGGFSVRRPLPTRALPLLDPLLLIDEMGPARYAPGEAVGAPDHPHRGFETVTYMLAGRFVHEDSAGHRGEIGPGDVQWMTAGAGVVHSEMPHPEIVARGGEVHGFQLWINLPAAEKMSPPRYQDLRREAIPRAAGEGWEAAVIAGDLLGARGPAETRTPMLLADVALRPGAALALDLPEDHAALVYVFSGALTAAGRHLGDGQAGVLGRGAGVRLASDRGGRALVVGGRPIGEPVARYGPFVMNTAEEIHQAFADYRSGRMGRIHR